MQMRPIFTRLVAALVVTGTVAAAAPAEARDRWGHRYEHRWDGDRHWRGDRWRGDGWRGDRHWRGDRWRGRGYGYYAPRRYYYEPRYYGYGYGYPRGHYYYRDRGGDALIGAIAGIAIGAAIAGAD
ncbi:hypothetical protein HRJ34_11470 [Rhizorhabdus wittichii]|jgi:hypothetical protein|uniref:Uncharacterized protein n=2 Tax=Rhizorhabdus wittichii TaxID=160791 RepID=A0A975D7B4_9SPHN|nr:hypothetical protein HRJ34_11470 [Rhizorhabdus wittichii]